MVTNEERREVAENLRILAGHREVDKDMVEDALGLYMGECVDGYDPVSVNELADLIEPEPERMCHPFVSPDGAGWYAIGCSNCGHGFADNNPDKAYLLRISKRSDIMPRYCPNCGAKVIEE